MPIIDSLLIFSPTLQDALIDKNGLPLAAGIITCYADNSRTTLKNWYYQTGIPGNYTYNTLPNPMVLSAAGTIQDVNGNDVIPGFYPYSELDSTTPEPYYITVDNSQGQRQFTRANFPFVASLPQGPNQIPTYQNLIVNNTFWRNVGTKDVTNPLKQTPYFYAPLTLYYETLAPSQHDGFMLPDFNFCKDAQGATETVTFEEFSAAPTESQQLIGDVTPQYYCKFSCIVTGAETIKFFSFPIQLHIRNLINTDYVATIQARASNSLATNLIFSIYQSTGTDGDLGGNITTKLFNLNGTWNRFELYGTFPETTVNVGDGQDDGFYLLIGFPASQLLEVEFAMPSLYLGTQAPTLSFATYDMVDAVINSPRTGDIRTSINSFYPFGWVAMNDGTIGNSPDSIGVSKATARNNPDTWQLYNLLWSYAKPFDSGANFNPICQMFTNGIPPVATNYGTSAIADFNAGKLLKLTSMFGKVLVGNVPVDALLPDVYSQTFTATNVVSTFTVANNTPTVTVPTITGLVNGMLITVSTTGTLPTPLVAGTAYYIQNIVGNTFNLSTTQNGNPITFTSVGAGVQSLNNQLNLNVISGASFYVGMPVTVDTTGTLPGNLTANTIFYVANIAGNTITLASSYANALAGFPVLAYVNAGAGTHTVLCQVSGISVGEYFHRLSIGEMPAHNHPNSTAQIGLGTAMNAGGGAAYAAHNNHVVPLNVQNQGGNKPHLNMQPGTYYNVYIKL